MTLFRGHMVLMLLLAAPVVTAGQATAEERAESQATERTIPRSEAVRALRTFEEDPVHNIEAASVFMKYINEDSAVHVSMNSQFVPWMYESHPAYAQAILLSAYAAGNFRSQLENEGVLDDPAAGLQYVVEVYQQLQDYDSEISIDVLNDMVAQKQQGRLEQYIETMIARPEYQED